MAETSEEPSDDIRVRRSWSKAVAAGDLVGRLFYSKLFEIAPESRTMFPEVIDDQAAKLLQTLNWIIDHLDAPESLVPAAESLAVRHVRYGVTTDHYPAVGKALIATLRQALGSEFNAEDEAAWLRVYTELSDIMTKAAYQSG